jgi:hypothetical protein
MDKNLKEELIIPSFATSIDIRIYEKDIRRRSFLKLLKG